MEKLPNNWVETTIKEVNFRKSSNVSPDKFPEQKFELYSVPIFEEGKPEILEGAEIKSSKQVVEEGEVLLCKINPRINRVWQVGNFTDYPKICSSEWIIVDSKEIIDHQYLRYVFSTPFYRELLQSEVSGVGGSLTRARPKIVEHYNFPLAPLPEQKRIVAKLDGLFAHLEEVKGRLAKVPELLKQFRQSVLTQAVTGKLTEEWREGKELLKYDLNSLELERKELKTRFELEIKNKKSFKYKPANLPELGGRSKGLSELFRIPDSWNWVCMDQVLYNLSDGPHFSPKYVSKDDGKRFISMRNISFGQINFDDCKYVSENDHIEFVKRGKPESGDVLYTKGGTTGIPCVIQSDTDFSYWVHVALLKPIRKYVESKFLMYTLGSDLCFKQSQALTHGVGNQDLGLTRMVFISFPLPNIKEQAEIVRRVESLFAKADAIQAQYESLVQKIEDLTPTILAKAFRGELVEQLPSDGDARELLEKIKKLKTKK